MTLQPQQPQQHCNNEEICRFYLYRDDEPEYPCQKENCAYRSRPLPSALKAERERVLDLIKKWGIENETSVDYGYYDGLLFLSDLHKYIESLRGDE